jgi:hypothetical protein
MGTNSPTGGSSSLNPNDAVALHLFRQGLPGMSVGPHGVTIPYDQLDNMRKMLDQLPRQSSNEQHPHVAGTHNNQYASLRGGSPSPV